MQRQALRDLVDLLALPMKAKSDEVESLRGDRGDRGAVGGVMAGGEELLRVERRRQPALERAPKRPLKLFRRSREDEDGLPDEPAIDLPGCVDIGFAGELRIGSDEPAGQETGDIEFLPACEIIPHRDGDLGIEAHEHDCEPARQISS